ncbi:hypothetical protein ECC02_011233 [Trypanosoma cruzi]|uniref:Uncharacterized protein n=1 Tax=Trypanosoma cruzi TaxID=5693 RepID=A0A7J6XNE2_TRYCR|nr:hypothetical protein ECC02_011233 [Trypanosoma cruzi]
MESNRGDERCGRHTQRARHMRRGQQPGMHRTPHTTHDTHSNPRQQAHTHTHSPAATPTHRWKREKQTGAAHKAPPHVHTARAVRRICTPHGGCAHTQKKVQRTQQHKSKVTIKKEIHAHHADCWSTGSAANIHHKNSSVAVGLRPHSSHSTSCRPGHHRSRSCCTRNKKQKREVVWETTVLLSLLPCEAVFTLLVAVSLLNPSLWAAGVTVPVDVPSVLLLHSSSPLLLWRVWHPLRSDGSHYD